MKSFFVQFNWKLRVPAKHFNSGTTVISMDAENIHQAKAKTQLRFCDKDIRFTHVAELHPCSLITAD